MSMDSQTITLRRLRPTDADGMMQWVGDDRVTQFTRWHSITSEKKISLFIDQMCGPQLWHRSICLNNRSIGLVWAIPGSNESRHHVDVGYALAVEYWGQGIATKAVKMALYVVIKELPEIERLQGLVFVENKASQRVLEKAGFVKEGLLRKYVYGKGNFHDMFVYSLLRADAINSVS